MTKTPDQLTERQIAGTFRGVLASGFWVGFMPFAPGTWASAAILPVGWLIGHYTGYAGLIGAAALVFVIGVWAAEFVVRRLGAEDPSLVVIDEYAGQLLTLAAAPLSWPAYGVGFFAFRVFDILKPWPASWADRDLAGGFGAMTDDIVAGLYGALTMLVFRYLNWL